MTFDSLVKLETVSVIRNDKKQYDSLRVMLITKLKKYKEDMDSIGFLSDEIKARVLSCTYDRKTAVATFKLSAPKPRTEYVLLSSEPTHETE